jgi:hypothetical protein
MVGAGGRAIVTDNRAKDDRVTAKMDDCLERD